MQGWRVIGLEKRDIFTSLALDDVALDSVGSGGDPIVRFWTWDSDCASVGRFQSIGGELDLDYAKKCSISVARRNSGGGAVYNGAGDEILYSIIYGKEERGRALAGSYEGICARIVKGLGMIGIGSRFLAPNTVTVGNEKISGNAKLVRSGTSLQHGTILYRPNKVLMDTILRPGKNPKGIGVRSNAMPVTGICEHSAVTLGGAYDAIRRAFLDGCEHYDGAWTKSEMCQAEKIASSKYENDEWTFSL